MTDIAVTESSTKSASHIYSALRRTRPGARRELKNYIKVFLGIDVPDGSICDEHCSPMDYLWYCYNADFAADRRANADAVVWANRGGGKTKLAAVATLLVPFPVSQFRVVRYQNQSTYNT